jgi:hypothetical protein
MHAPADRLAEMPFGALMPVHGHHACAPYRPPPPSHTHTKPLRTIFPHQSRVSADPADPEVAALEARLALLGPAPRRGPVTQEQAAAAWARAEAEVAAGRVRLWLRLPGNQGDGAQLSMGNGSTEYVCTADVGLLDC